MEDANSIWIVGISALLAGVIIGLLAYRLLGRSTRESENVQHELDAARDEIAAYKASVNQHFNKTSELVNDLTQNYVKVYQHLAEGAHTLGDSKTFDNLLEQHPGKVSLTVDGDTPAPLTQPQEATADMAASVETAIEPGAADDAEPTPVDYQQDSARTRTVDAADQSEDSAATPESVTTSDLPSVAAETQATESSSETDSILTEDEEKPETTRTVH